jgi:hypothetical protein
MALDAGCAALRCGMLWSIAVKWELVSRDGVCLHPQLRLVWPYWVCSCQALFGLALWTALLTV